MKVLNVLVLLGVSVFPSIVVNGQDVDKAEICGKKFQLDLVWVVDESGSIGEDAYDNQLKPFIQQVADEFTLGDNLARMGLIEFSGSVNDVFDLDSFNRNDDWNAAVNGLNFNGGGTRSRTALEFLRTDYFSKTVNNKRPDVLSRSAVIFASDGNPNQNQGEDGQALKDELEALLAADSPVVNGGKLADKFIFLRIGENITEDLFDGVAGFDPSTDSILANINDFDAIKDQLLAEIACDEINEEDDNVDVLPFLLGLGGLGGAAALVALARGGVNRRRRKTTMAAAATGASFRSAAPSVATRSVAPSMYSQSVRASGYSGYSGAGSVVGGPPGSDVESVAPPPPPYRSTRRPTTRGTKTGRFMHSIRTFFDPRLSPSHVPMDGKVVGWLGGT